MEDHCKYYFNTLVGAVSLVALFITRYMLKRVASGYRNFSVTEEDRNRFLLDPKIWCNDGWVLFEEVNGGLFAKKTDFNIFIRPMEGRAPLLHFVAKIVPGNEDEAVLLSQAGNMYKSIHGYFMG